MESAKKMRNLKLLTAAIVIALVSLTSSNAFAFGGKPGKGGGHHGHGGCGNVGAPLDGGILTLLIGGAGAAYLAVRKKKQE